MTKKISACIITRDDSSTIEALLQSIKGHVDQICVTDTGSVDNTPEICRRYADRWQLYLGCNDPESGLINDFADARNKSLELADHPVVCWFDADDVVENAHRLRELTGQLDGDLAQIMLEYQYAFDESGRCSVSQQRERLLFPRHRFEWRFPIHETCLPKLPLEGGPLRTTVSDAVRVIHRRQQSSKAPDPGRNLRILRKWYRDTGGGEPRCIYYLGTELLIAGHAGEALGLLRRYVDISTWRDDDRCMAALSIAKCYRALDDQNAAIEWAAKALTMKSWITPYWEIAKAAFQLSDEGYDADYNLRRSIWWAEEGLRHVSEQPDYVETLQARHTLDRYEIHLILNVARSRLGDLEGAIRSCEEGLVGLPGHPMLEGNLKLYRDELAKRRITREVAGLVERGKLSEKSAATVRLVVGGQLEGVEIRGVSAEQQMSGAPGPSPSPSPVEPRTPSSGKLDIVFFVGPGLEPWNPATLEAGGMGGSETMVWELSKRLAGLGNRVRVFGHCTPTMQGMFSGVEWLDWSAFRGVECDVLISSRRPQAVDDDFGCKARARILYVHDVHCGTDLTHSRELRFDRVFALSKWHKQTIAQCYPLMNPDKIVVTRNGIDPGRFAGTETRNPHWAVISSSPDRGLWTTLDIWPEVRKAVPDAELHVAYGFLNWETGARNAGDTAALQSIQHLKHMVTHTPGVVFHDRINQRELAILMKQSGCWLASTWFTETSCLGAMEAQAAGCRVICTPLAALKETVASRGQMVGVGDTIGMPDPVEWRSPEYMKAFTTEVIRAMTTPDDDPWPSADNDWPREKLAATAADLFSLETLAEDWSGRLLPEIIADVSEKVVPQFRPMEPAA